MQNRKYQDLEDEMYDHWIVNVVKPSNGVYAWVYNEDENLLGVAVADSDDPQGWHCTMTGITHYWCIEPPPHLPTPV